MPWFLTRAVGGLPPAPSEGTCPLAPPRPRERGGGAKSDGSRHNLACLGSRWWFRVFCSHERAISSQLRLRYRGASRVRLVVRLTRHRRACALWHLSDPRERGGGAKSGGSHGAFGLVWTRIGGFVSFNSRKVKKSPVAEPDVVIHHACGRWAATRAIGGHVSSGTSRPSRASFGRSQTAARMGLFGLALTVPCLLRQKNCESREVRRRSRGFSGVRSVPPPGRSRIGSRTVAAAHWVSFGLASLRWWFLVLTPPTSVRKVASCDGRRPGSHVPGRYLGRPPPTPSSAIGGQMISTGISRPSLESGRGVGGDDDECNTNPPTPCQ